MFRHYWTYWAASTTQDILTSALNRTSLKWPGTTTPVSLALSASGGGASTLLLPSHAGKRASRGIPTDSKRDVPDIALYSSPNYPGYLYCTSDQSGWIHGPNRPVAATAVSAIRTSDDLTVAGGTSFAAPIFAGMLAIINQKKGYTGGQGLINPTLYTMAANSATYASAFHDITSGSGTFNECTAGSTYCSGTIGFPRRRRL